MAEAAGDARNARVGDRLLAGDIHFNWKGTGSDGFQLERRRLQLRARPPGNRDHGPYAAKRQGNRAADPAASARYERDSQSPTPNSQLPRSLRSHRQVALGVGSWALGVFLVFILGPEP